MYLLVLSENLKTSLCSRTTVFPGFVRTFSFGARLTPLNLASLEKRKKQRFNGFCHSPFQLFHVKQFLEKRKQNVSRETFLGWIKGGRKRETAPAAKAVPVRGKLLPSLRGERGGGADIFLGHSGSTYIIPKLSLYSTGLMPPKVILIRSSLYQ